MRTPEEVADLKRNWRNDPCWDIEETEGYEDYRDELLAYRMEMEAVWKRVREVRDARRRIQTVHAKMLVNDGGDGDDEISLLMAAGWTVIDVSYVSYVEDGGRVPVAAIRRFVTLTRDR